MGSQFKVEEDAWLAAEKRGWRNANISGRLIGAGFIQFVLVAAFNLKTVEKWDDMAPFIITSMIVGFCFLAVGIYFGAKAESGSKQRDAIKQARVRWVESHGFKLKFGDFEKLDFPQVSPARSQTFGDAELLRVSTGKPVSVRLKFDSDEGYALFGADKVKLSPLGQG